MQKKNLPIVAGIILLVLVAGAVYFSKSNKSKPTETTPTQTTPSNEISASFVAQNNSRETGTANLAENNAQVVINLTVDGAPAGLAQPAHIHKGTCANLDPKPLYPLQNILNGSSQTTLPNKTLNDLKNEGPLAVNVHKSAQQASVYVACADLNFSGNAIPQTQVAPTTPPPSALPTSQDKPGYN